MYRKSVVQVALWEILVIFLITSASATIFMIWFGYNKCTGLQATCGRERLAYCAEFIDTGVRPVQGTWTEDLWSTDENTCINNCVMEGSRPEEFCCAIPTDEECEEAFG